MSTSDYQEESRVALGTAVAKARAAAGYRSRSALAEAAGVGLRSIDKLELGEPGVGQRTLFAVGRALPRWTEDTPQAILDGGPVPSTEAPTEPDRSIDSAIEVEPTVTVTTASMRLVEEIRKELADRGIEMTPEMMVAFLQGVDQQLGAELRQVELKTTERDRSP